MSFLPSNFLTACVAILNVLIWASVCGFVWCSRVDGRRRTAARMQNLPDSWHLCMSLPRQRVTSCAGISICISLRNYIFTFWNCWLPWRSGEEGDCIRITSSFLHTLLRSTPQIHGRGRRPKGEIWQGETRQPRQPLLFFKNISPPEQIIILQILKSVSKFLIILFLALEFHHLSGFGACPRDCGMLRSHRSEIFLFYIIFYIYKHFLLHLSL